MATDNETVAEIVKRVRRECSSYPLPTASAEMLKLVREFETAHKREVDAILKDRDDMYKSEQETIAKTNAWFEEYQTLKREVAELRKCLNRAVNIICGKCYDKVRARCARGEMKDCEVKELRKALEGAKHDSASS